MRLDTRVRTLEATLQTTLDAQQQRAIDYVTEQLGAAWAVRFRPLIQQGHLWLDCQQVCYLAARSGCSPRHLEQELSSRHALGHRPVYHPQAVAIIREWLATAEGQRRPVDPLFIWARLEAPRRLAVARCL